MGLLTGTGCKTPCIYKIYTPAVERSPKLVSEVVMGPAVRWGDLAILGAALGSMHTVSLSSQYRQLDRNVDEANKRGFILVFCRWPKNYQQ